VCFEDAATGRFRLQKYESPDELANDAKAKVETFIIMQV